MDKRSLPWGFDAQLSTGANRTNERLLVGIQPIVDHRPQTSVCSSERKPSSVGQAKHKKQYSTLRATTSLDPDRAAQIAKHVGDSVTSSIPGGASVRFEGASPGRLDFTVRGGAHTWGSGAVMSFHMSIAADGYGRTAIVTEIGDFRTSQTTYLFIPVGPKLLEGYRTYKKFAEQFASALCQQDPQASTELVEVPSR